MSGQQVSHVLPPRILTGRAFAVQIPVEGHIFAENAVRAFAITRTRLDYGFTQAAES